MKASAFARLAGTLFVLVALLHVYRLFSDFPIQIGSFAVPHQASWAAALIAGGLGILGLRARG